MLSGTAVPRADLSRSRSPATGRAEPPGGVGSMLWALRGGGLDCWGGQPFMTSAACNSACVWKWLTYTLKSTLGKPGLFSQSKYLTSWCSTGVFLIRKLRQISKNRTKHGFPAQGWPPSPCAESPACSTPLLVSWRHLLDSPPVKKNVIVLFWFVSIRRKALPLSKPNVHLIKSLLHLPFFWQCQQVNVNAWRTDKYVFSGDEVAHDRN